MEKTIARQHMNVVLIEGANHFFDQAHEFDLTDAIEKLLSERQGL